MTVMTIYKYQAPDLGCTVRVLAGKPLRVINQIGGRPMWIEHDDLNTVDQIEVLCLGTGITISKDDWKYFDTVTDGHLVYHYYWRAAQ